MRWVVAEPGPDFSVLDVHRGWVEALRGHGEHVVDFNLGDRLAFYSNAWIETDRADDVDGDGGRPVRLRKALDADAATDLAVNGLAATLWKVRPHILFITTGFLVPAGLLDHARRHGTYVIVHHTEEPYEVERELAYAGHADLNLVNDPTHLERFREVAPTLYVPQAYRETVHRPCPDGGRGCHPDYASDFTFIGTGFGSRRWFLEQMAEAGAFDGLDTAIAGNWQGVLESSPLRPYLPAQLAECVDNADTVRWYQHTRCGINLYRRERDADHPGLVGGWAMGPREVEMAAAGAFFLRDPRPEGDQVLHMLPAFADPAGAVEVLRWWLAHDDEREKAAQAAREAVADRTFTAHARHLLRLLDKN